MIKNGYIRCFGNQRTGLGHVYRSVSLASFLERKGIKISFLYFEYEKNTFESIIESKSFQIHVMKKIMTLQADFLIYDMPFIETQFLKYFKDANPCSKILALDFFDYQNTDVNVVLNLFSHGAFVRTDKIYHEGLKCAIIREEFEKLRSAASRKLTDVHHILITFGSADPANNTMKVLEWMKGLDGFRISVICGKLFKRIEEIESIANQNQYLDIRRDVNDIARWMNKADVVICGGGTTLVEAMYLSLPALVVPQTENEKIFAESLAANQYCYLLENLDQESFRILFQKIADKDNRLSISQRLSKIDIGLGKEIIYKELA